MSLRRGDNALGWILGLDERCIQVEGINEARAQMERGGYDPRTVAFGIVLMRKLLLAAGARVDGKLFQPLIAAYRAKDIEAAKVELPRAFAHLDQLEQTTGALRQGATCPRLSPAVQLAMPAGRYRVDWLDDRTGALLRSDTPSGGSEALRAPAFERHLAVVVARVP